MNRGFLAIAVAALFFFSIPRIAWASLTTSPKPLIVGERATLTGTNMVYPQSGVESCNGPDPSLPSYTDCVFTAQVWFRHNGFAVKKATIVSSDPGQMMIVVPDVPTGEYAVEILHRYSNYNFSESGGDAMVGSISVENHLPSATQTIAVKPSVTPEPTAEVSPSQSPSEEAPTIVITQDASASSNSHAGTSTSFIVRFQNFASAIARWWSGLFRS